MSNIENLFLEVMDEFDFRRCNKIYQSIANSGNDGSLESLLWERIGEHYTYLFKKYKSCLGMEIINSLDNETRNDRMLWDNILSKSNRPVFGFSNDDSHSIDEVGFSFNFIIAKSLNENSIREALEKGRFFAVAKTARQEKVNNKDADSNEYRPSANLTDLLPLDKLQFPMFNKLIIEDRCRIHIEQCNDKVEWICNGKLLHGISELDLQEGITDTYGYFRFQIKNDEAIIFSQPFFFKNNKITFNPYEDITNKFIWDGWVGYKSILHMHTKKSDGENSAIEMIKKYKDMDFSVIAITDHNKRLVADSIDDNLILIPGSCECSNGDHINTYWSDFNINNLPDDMEEILELVENDGGISVLNHPGRKLSERLNNILKVENVIENNFHDIEVMLEKSHIEYNTESVNEHIKLVAKKDIESEYFINWFFKMDEWKDLMPEDFDFSILENTSSNVVFGYFTNDKLDAIIRVKIKEEPYAISMLFVNPETQRQGVGNALMAHVVNLYKDHPMTLTVFGDNTTAIHLYMKYGFKIVSKHFNLDEGDESEKNRWVFTMEREGNNIDIIEEDVDITLEPVDDFFEDVTSEVLKRLSPEKRNKIVQDAQKSEPAPEDEDLPEDEESNILDEPLEDDEVKEEPPEVKESFPKKTDAEEASKNGVVRKQLYIEFIQYAKKINSKNTFGSLFDKDAFSLYSFVPHELRYFYRLANPLLCVLNDGLTFFSVSELRKINNGNKSLHECIIFASNELGLLKVFNMQDKQVYDGHFDKEVIMDQVIAKSFDLYIQQLAGVSLVTESTEDIETEE